MHCSVFLWSMDLSKGDFICKCNRDLKTKLRTFSVWRCLLELKYFIFCCLRLWVAVCFQFWLWSGLCSLAAPQQCSSQQQEWFQGSYLSAQVYPGSLCSTAELGNQFIKSISWSRFKLYQFTFFLHNIAPWGAEHSEAVPYCLLGNTKLGRGGCAGGDTSWMGVAPKGTTEWDSEKPGVHICSLWHVPALPKCMFIGLISYWIIIVVQ